MGREGGGGRRGRPLGVTIVSGGGEVGPVTGQLREQQNEHFNTAADDPGRPETRTIGISRLFSHTVAACAVNLSVPW